MQWWYPFSIKSYASQENGKKPKNWTAFVWIQKSAPRKIYFLTDFIKTHLCASLDGGIGKCHQSQTWRYQGATVTGETPNATKRSIYVMTRQLLRARSQSFCHRALLDVTTFGDTREWAFEKEYVTWFLLKKYHVQSNGDKA